MVKLMQMIAISLLHIVIALPCTFASELRDFPESPDPNLFSPRFEKVEVLRANFRQEKHIQILSSPFVSKGTLVYSKEGVLWQLQQPYPVTIVIKPDELIERTDKDILQRTQTDENPFFFTIVNILLALFSGDINLISDTFEVEIVDKQEQWQLSLAPKDETLAQVINSIRVTGDRFVDQVVIEEVGGDQTIIRFTDQKTTPVALSSLERIYFEE